MFDLTNKVVLLTGATGGIGKSIAKKMKEKGAKLILSNCMLEQSERINKAIH